MKSESSRWTKKRLAVELSHLDGFSEVSVELEQYATPSEIAAEWVWNAVFLGDIAGKVILDAACGPGVLGCGALLMGAKQVYFVDKSPEALELARKNVNTLAEAYEIGKSEFLCMDITQFTVPVEVVIQNPPFGTQVRHHDKLFLEKAFTVGKTVYSMHKATTVVFVEAIVKDYGFMLTNRWDYDFRIGMSLPWHTQEVYIVKVTLWRMVKR